MPLFELNNNYAGFVAYSISTYIIHWSDQIESCVLARRFWNEEYFWGKLYFSYFAHTNLLLRVLECSTTPRMQLRSGVREKWFSAKINIYGMYICLFIVYLHHVGLSEQQQDECASFVVAGRCRASKLLANVPSDGVWPKKTSDRHIVYTWVSFIGSCAAALSKIFIVIYVS